jgi:hypothetical protein
MYLMHKKGPEVRSDPYIVDKTLLQIESVSVHDLGPSFHEVFYKLIFSIVACIDFSKGA